MSLGWDPPVENSQTLKSVRVIDYSIQGMLCVQRMNALCDRVMPI